MEIQNVCFGASLKKAEIINCVERSPELLRFSFTMISRMKLHHSFDQSHAEVKPIATWSSAFSRDLSQLVYVSYLSRHWPLVIS